MKLYKRCVQRLVLPSGDSECTLTCIEREHFNPVIVDLGLRH